MKRTECPFCLSEIKTKENGGYVKCFLCDAVFEAAELKWESDDDQRWYDECALDSERGSDSCWEEQ